LRRERFFNGVLDLADLVVVHLSIIVCRIGVQLELLDQNRCAYFAGGERMPTLSCSRLKSFLSRMEDLLRKKSTMFCRSSSVAVDLFWVTRAEAGRSGGIG
jgi:hypothetical protein